MISGRISARLIEVLQHYFSYYNYYYCFYFNYFYFLGKFAKNKKPKSLSERNVLILFLFMNNIILYLFDSDTKLA